MTESAPLLKPIVLESQKLGMGKIGSMAMSLNGQRVYLGRRSSYERSRLNLGVLTLDAAGRPVGKPKLYPDSDVPKPIDRPSTVARIMVNPAHPRLYLAVVDESAAMKLPKNLTVYTLDLEGDPWGSPRTYDSGNPAKWVTALALHPDLPLLYLVGPDVPNVYAYNLNDEGEPHGSPLSFKNIGNTWKAKVAVSRVGERLYRLYLATAGDNKPAIEVINLDPTGTPLPNTLRSFPVPPTPNPNPAKGPLLGGRFCFMTRHKRCTGATRCFLWRQGIIGTSRTSGHSMFGPWTSRAIRSARRSRLPSFRVGRRRSRRTASSLASRAMTSFWKPSTQSCLAESRSRTARPFGPIPFPDRAARPSYRVNQDPPATCSWAR